MEPAVAILESYRGREIVIRTLYYGLKFASGFSVGDSLRKIDAAVRALSDAQVVLRMFDDLSMLQWTLSYGLGRQV